MLSIDDAFQTRYRRCLDRTNPGSSGFTTHLSLDVTCRNPSLIFSSEHTRLEIAERHGLRTRGELSLIVHELVPEILRAQGDEKLCEIAERLEQVRLERAEELLREAARQLADVQAEADDPDTCVPGNTPTSHRVTALRPIEVASLEVHMSFSGPYPCGAGWPLFLEQWSAETLPLAAVAAGVDPRRVVALVFRAIVEIDRGPLEPPSWWRG